MKFEPIEAKKIITDIVFDESKNINTKEADALRCGVQALTIVEKLKEEYTFFSKSDLSGERNVAQILELILKAGNALN